jgi:hypothetical protein
MFFVGCLEPPFHVYFDTLLALVMGWQELQASMHLPNIVRGNKGKGEHGATFLIEGLIPLDQLNNSMRNINCFRS